MCSMPNSSPEKLCPETTSAFRPKAPSMVSGNLFESDDNAAVALEMVSEAAAAIRELEEQSAQAVAHAQHVVTLSPNELESEEARAERAEMAQEKSEAEVKELSAAFARTRSDLETARGQLADKSEELSQDRRRDSA